MKLTVIVPVYNGEDTIEACLRALIGQEHATLGEDYSILVVDDGSTDGTARLARKFPVEILSFPENRGRIVARLAGAKHARTDRILFVDARIRLPGDTLAKLEAFSEHRAVIGEVDVEGTKYETIIHTVLYLIRRRYYGKEHFPMQTDSILITRENFKRAPKGTALLLIDRDLFIRLTPERTGRDVNDDTLLFHNMIFRENSALLRSKNLLFQYSQRTNWRQFTAWLFHRGVRFSDFYLRPGGYYFLPFLLALLLAAAALAVFPPSPARLSALLLAANAGAALYLAENRKDFFTAFFALPPVVLIFGTGVAKFWTGWLISAFKGGTSPARPNSPE